MKKSLLTVVSVLLVAAFVLAACGTPATTEAPAAPADTAAPAAPAATDTAAAPAAPVEITIWHAYGTGSAEETAMTALIAQAQKDLPQYKLTVLQIPFNDIFNKYATDVAAGGGPDIFIAPNDNLGDEARAGLIADITDIAKGKTDGYSKMSLDGMSIDGKLYAIPESLKAVEFWYNKSLLPTPPATTDDLKKLMDSGTEVSISFSCYHYYGFYSAFGGQIFDPSWKVIADQGGVADAMGYLNDIYQIGKKNHWPQSDTDGLAPFTEGKAVAITNGNWAMGDYKKALGDNLAVAPLPAGPKGPATPMLGVDGYYFNPNSQNKDAALEVALYLTNPASQTIMMNQAGHVPARTDVTITDPLIKGLVDAFNTGYTIRPQVKQLGNYWANFCDPSGIFEKGMAPADWVKTATEGANK